MIEADVVDAMVALPGQLFFSTQIPACLWILARNKSANGHRDRRGEVLFIDARNLGHMIDRVRRIFSDEDIERIAVTYRDWRSRYTNYEDAAGFCRSVSLDEIREHNHVLTPGRYVGAADADDDGVSFDEKLSELREVLLAQFTEGRALEGRIVQTLDGLGADA